jgi:hypothetical protein
MDRFYRSNAEGAEDIRAIILFDDVTDDYGIDDWAESDENYVEPREGELDCASECAEDATSDDYCCSELDAT